VLGEEAILGGPEVHQPHGCRPPVAAHCLIQGVDLSPPVGQVEMFGHGARQGYGRGAQGAAARIGLREAG
jgi:hypothetical protein